MISASPKDGTPTTVATTGLRRRPLRFRARHAVAVFAVLILLSYGISMAEVYSALAQRPKDCNVRQLAAAPDAATPAGFADPDWLVQRRGTVNDASCLNRTAVYGVAQPTDEAELGKALAFAREHDLKVAPSGARHSMGGQASWPGALILDMTAMNRITIDEASGTVRVGGGALWRQVLEALHPHGLSVTGMPSIDVLSVGGTLSVNAHGTDFRTGSLAGTVRSLRLMKADGSIVTLGAGHDPDLFHAVIGGYGLFGVIVEAELATVPDELYRLEQRVVATADLPDVLDALGADENNRLMSADLATAGSPLLDQAIVYTHARFPGSADEPRPELLQEPDSPPARFLFNLARHRGPAQWLKWTLQRDLMPRLRQCGTSRNEALRAAEACLVSRSQAMYSDLKLLRHTIPQYTDILHEYFLPRDALVPFLRDTAAALQDSQAVALHASVRVVHAEPILLDYARGDRYSVVLYLSQEVSAEGNRDMADLTRTLVDRALAAGGTFYLPYQQHYSREDLARAYPRIDEFFALKRRHDPELLFMNNLYRRFA
ncbi:FAD-binding oxidoreductase [Micropruina sp.]|uniref:FAD-binding oxidoreductase n=1 Tax=Micropruina sp. TaxID=2737536 RepID=UPI00260A9CD0|nr:FAD-binding oxidoreductase [Micropruina sp.]